MKTIVMSLGGSIIVPDQINVSFLKEFKKLIEEFSKNNRIIIVCGGGKTCRRYLEALDSIEDASHMARDWLGISATHMNAHLIKCMFEDQSFEHVLSDPTKPVKTNKNIIIAGGWKPGHSSDMGAVEFAKLFGATDVLNISNIDYVYDKDPRKYQDAKPFEKLSWEEFFQIVGTDWKPGMNAPFDPIASKKAEEYGLRVIITKGTIENVKAYINGKNVGTIIQ
jgi:uridylate kinase